MPDAKLHYDRKDKENHSKKADSRLMEEEGEKRNGSDSDATGGRKSSRLHENHRDRNTPQDMRDPAEFERDLTANNLAGEDHGMSNAINPANEENADSIKSMHSTTLADLTNDELKSVLIIPEGTRLDQGAKYIDLHNLEKGEFTATSEMVAGSENAFVAKKDTDYVLWNRLNQVDNVARLDEAE